MTGNVIRVIYVYVKCNIKYAYKIYLILVYSIFIDNKSPSNIVRFFSTSRKREKRNAL